MGSGIKYTIALLSLLLIVSVGFNVYLFKKPLSIQKSIDICNDIIRENSVNSNSNYVRGSYSSDDSKNVNNESVQRYEKMMKVNAEIEAEKDPEKQKQMMDDLIRSLNE